MASSGRTDDRLADRYGRRTPARRRAVTVVLAVLAAVGLLLVVWLGWLQASTPVSAQLQGYQVQSPSSTTVTVDVYRRDGDAVRCEVYAQAADHSVVGEDVIEIPEGDAGNIVVSTTITTERQAVNGVLRGCEVVD